ncbi:5-formyltetrahydrofolate cyclo-ligase [Tenacibaculum sp. 1_MG-2023]|uniref:5-formyltetrahydrofolate cyclo-ligase n=1 Tax=Tenacibaculum sp. 1_MG-2023 TaxID=3062653 RepID=UPI0026E2005A|nr:5-formyltetrahydrofolate cyclo-ligase [Tenacibaculum sp. 1_MG-2023]MDO6676035.1 5-formyltetrahydrofolate cyclo-ligase [Tenacibaculum sp. 1_MG-2023]
MLKPDLRKLYKQKRNILTEVEKEKLQKSIYQQIFKLQTSDVRTVHLFLSMRKFNEVDTKPIIDFFREKGKKIIVSRCNFEDDTLSHFYFEKDTKLELNKFGVPEPVNAEEANVKDIDLVFVPMLISDEQKYRVGYGKGFYDRFLSECREDTRTVGLNFFPPIKKIEDTHEFDVPLDFMIYPK